MLTIPMQGAGPATSRTHPSTASVLVIGRSEKVLGETVDLLREDGRVAGATNDFGNVPALFDVASLDLVVFGGMVPPETKEALRIDLAVENPALTFVQGMAGIPGLIAAQVEAALAPPRDAPASVTYDGDSRTVTISLTSLEVVRMIAFWGTAFVPPDPESTSAVIFDEKMGAGEHTLELPSSVPPVASFVVVRVGTEVHPYMVGPMPRGTTAVSGGGRVPGPPR